MAKNRAHVLAVPYPAQGHLIPMMELVQGLTTGGIKVTIVVTELIHRRISKSANGGGESDPDLVKFAVIPDGMEPSDDRGNVGRTLDAMAESVPAQVEALIQKINGEDDEIACLIVDYALVWPVNLARRLKIKRSAFMTAPIALLAINESIPKLIDEGVIDGDGEFFVD